MNQQLEAVQAELEEAQREISKSTHAGGDVASGRSINSSMQDLHEQEQAEDQAENQAATEALNNRIETLRAELAEQAGVRAQLQQRVRSFQCHRRHTYRIKARAEASHTHLLLFADASRRGRGAVCSRGNRNVASARARSSEGP